MRRGKTKPVYLYDLNKNMLNRFATTYECACFFGKDAIYINHNLKYCKKIRRDGEWYLISRLDKI